VKLKNVRLKNVKRFEDLEISLFDELTQKIRDRTVIVGKNGSGKTTLLEVIYWVTRLMEQGEEGFHEAEVPLFALAGSELEFEIPIGRNLNSLRVSTGLTIEPYGTSDLVMGMTPSIHLNERPKHIFHAPTVRGTSIVHSISTAVAGIDEDPVIGNLLYFPTDRLTHFDVAGKGQLTNERPDFKWAYRYNRNHNEWKGSLEGYLCWLYWRDLKAKEQDPNAPSLFAEFKGLVNQFLEGKQITTVGLRYRVELEDKDTGRKFHLEDLSSGEKQIVMLIGEIFRHIRKGSIILIDEPEVHLHPVWQRIFVDTLTKLCKKYNAQMILATQSPKIAEFVLQREIIQLDDLLEESQR
jgi:ABC-type lipoprotein export system ATPase subunit